MGQEFPSLQSDGSQELSQDVNMSKDITKTKDNESKSKIDDFRVSRIVYFVGNCKVSFCFKES